MYQYYTVLTQSGWNKITVNLQTTFSNIFYEYRCTLLIISLHCVRNGSVGKKIQYCFRPIRWEAISLTQNDHCQWHLASMSQLKWDVLADDVTYNIKLALRWRHNGHDGVSNHQPRHCLPKSLFGCRSKKTSKLHVTGLCKGNSPGIGEFPAQMASYAENVSIW